MVVLGARGVTEALARPLGGAGVAKAGSLLASPRLHTAEKRSVGTAAHTAEHAGYQGQSTHGTTERVLRYPNGLERRIRYPAPLITEEEAPVDPATSYAEDWEPDRWGSELIAADSSSLWRSAPKAAPLPPASPAAPRPPGLQAPYQDTFTSPAALLRHLASEEQRAAGQELRARVRASYTVHTGCPWVLPRPVYFLACQQPGSQQWAAYTLRTRTPRQDTQDALSLVIRRRRPDGSPAIHVDEMRDGVVIFEDEDDAQRFASLLEADGRADVEVMGTDSHGLFRATSDVRGCCVLLARGGHLPQPAQLAAALRSQPALEDA